MDTPKKTDGIAPKNEFKNQLDELTNLTSKLRKNGLYILLILFCSIIFLVLTVFLKKFFYADNSDYGSSMHIVSICMGICILAGIIFLFVFNSFKNRGMIIYEELTEEIDWSANRKEYMMHPPMEIRITIKNFLKSTDLPFTIGANGSRILFDTIFAYFYWCVIGDYNQVASKVKIQNPKSSLPVKTNKNFLIVKTLDYF